MNTYGSPRSQPRYLGTLGSRYVDLSLVTCRLSLVTYLPYLCVPKKENKCGIRYPHLKFEARRGSAGRGMCLSCMCAAVLSAYAYAYAFPRLVRIIVVGAIYPVG